MVDEPTPAGSRRPVRCRPGSTFRLLLSGPILAQFPDLRILGDTNLLSQIACGETASWVGHPTRPNLAQLDESGKRRLPARPVNRGHDCRPSWPPDTVRSRRSSYACPCSCSMPRIRSACSPCPDLPAGPSWIRSEERVPIGEVPVERRLADIDRLVIAVLDDRPRHPAEDRLDDVEELRAGGERGQFDQGSPVLGPVLGRVDLLDSPGEHPGEA
jgi:hypothetical protein